jgi:hypothetical protein
MFVLSWRDAPHIDLGYIQSDALWVVALGPQLRAHPLNQSTYEAFMLKVMNFKMAVSL